MDSKRAPLLSNSFSRLKSRPETGKLQICTNDIQRSSCSVVVLGTRVVSTTEEESQCGFSSRRPPQFRSVCKLASLNNYQSFSLNFVQHSHMKCDNDFAAIPLNDDETAFAIQVSASRRDCPGYCRPYCRDCATLTGEKESAWRR